MSPGILVHDMFPVKTLLVGGPTTTDENVTKPF